MSNDHDRRRDLSKLRTIPLDDATHRRLRLYAHGLHEPGEAGETIARVAGEAIGAWLDRQEAMRVERESTPPFPACDHEWDIGDRSDCCIRCGAVQMRMRVTPEAGDPSEGAGELYGRWRR